MYKYCYSNLGAIYAACNQSYLFTLDPRQQRTHKPGKMERIIFDGMSLYHQLLKSNLFKRVLKTEICGPYF